MATILYAWEFGANLGHVGAFMPLARALRKAGHTVHWAVTQPAQVGDYLASEGFHYLPAPTISEQARQGPPLSYADILLRFGYADAKALFGLTGGWRQLMRLTGAQLVLTDHAPTAVLAARTLDLPVMMFSNGFTVPPRQNPLPNMRPWNPLPIAPLQALDQAACASINSVLARFQHAPIDCTAQLFDVAEESLISFPELDHYPNRGPARYWGSLPIAGGGAPIRWPEGDTPRVFAYLRNETPHHAAALEALASLPVRAAIYFPDVDPGLRARIASPQRQFLDHAADIAQASREADCAITYASLATSTAFLLAGKPLLMLPGHLEQFLVAQRVVAMGAGVLINPETPAGDLRPALGALLENPAYRENALAFATKYAAFDQGKVVDNLLRRIAELTTKQPQP